jgi:hypothetical protein
VLWLVRGAKRRGEPRQVISGLAASTADPNSFRACAAAADDDAPHSPARPTGTTGAHTDAPKPRNSILGVTG